MNTYHKICTKCKTSKPTNDFYKDKRSKDGLMSWCKSCRKKSADAYSANNLEKINSYQQEYRIRNSEKRKEEAKLYRKQNKEKVRLAKKKYRDNNIKKLREASKNYAQKRRNSDLLYNLISRIRRSINKPLKEGGYTKKSRTYEILGCSFEEFKVHIEKQFTEGMTWDNRSAWQLDHIKPISLGKSEEEIIALNHYTNFQPLWAEDNRIKSNKFS